jgi:hypothetical protein
LIPDTGSRLDGMKNGEILKTMTRQKNIPVTGWQREQWDFQNNEKTMENS